jgi:gliding motility-associated-like protein
MVIKILSTAKLGLFHFIVIFSLLLISIDVSAQCAGSDNTLPDVCDIPNVTSIDLFSYLGGSPTVGGTWTDDDLSEGLVTATGILNAQLIKRSGIYTYTYTVNNVAGCTDNSATITVTIGGYPGVGSIGNVCKDDSGFNLFQVFDSRTLDPQINGTWLDDDLTGAISGNILDATTLVVDKTYHFTYKMNAVGSCSEKSTTVQVVIKQPVYSGNPLDLKLCSDGLASYTNLDLNSRLSGEDANGTWRESTTSEINGPTDSTIDIQNIYNTKGPGKYNFAYTVLSKNPICPNKTSTVEIIIEKQLDFTGSTLVVNTDICENEIPTATYNAVLTQGTQVIADGIYEVVYTISGVITPIKTVQAFVGGVFKFPISSSHFQQVKDYTISIATIIDTTSLRICNNIIGTIKDVLHVHPLPKINNATLKIVPVCQTFDAVVEFLGTSNLTDGNYYILYNLSGTNIATAIPAVMNILGGKGSFPIPTALIPNTGTSTITITRITNATTGCTNSAALVKDFTINSLPNTSNLVVTLKDVCQGQPLNVQLSGLGTLTNITLSYTVSGVNTIGSQTIPLVVSAGNTSFQVPATSLLNTGNNTLIITDLTNTGNGCSTIINSVFKNFAINSIPSSPSANNQEFCETNLATVANLTPNGNQYKWYVSTTSATPLASSVLLATSNYFLKEGNAATGCESNATPISVLINTVTAPVLNPSGQDFCGIDKPTIQNLSNNTAASGNLSWFDAVINGTQLSSTDLLKEGFTYYGVDSSTVTNCSSFALAVTVSLTDCTATPGNFFIPDGFSPNGDGVNETFQIIDIEFLFPNYTLEIFNRYGNILFKGNINKPAWDGKNSNTNFINGDTPTGVYFYVIHYNKDNLSPKQGQLYLNR